MRVAVKCAYDGRKYFGFARQPGLQTVEGEILHRLEKHGLIVDPKQSHFQYASRTDKAVSALGTVIAFDTASFSITHLKDLQKDEQRVLFYGWALVDADFYPRYAKLRVYRYYLKKTTFSIDKILPILSLFTGTHNFSNFARIEESKDPLRTIENIVVTPTEHFFIIDFYAQTYLWHQIRRIISAVEKAAIGKITNDEVVHALTHPDEKVDFGVASAPPLILKDVVYDIDFEYLANHTKYLKNVEQKIMLSL